MKVYIVWDSNNWIRGCCLSEAGAWIIAKRHVGSSAKTSYFTESMKRGGWTCTAHEIPAPGEVGE